MAITTRLGKGSALSHAELDTNFTDLDTRSSDNDIRLTALEGQTLDARVTALEGDTLDARLDVLEGQTLNSRLTVLEGNTLDARLDVLEGQTLDTRLTAAEGSISTLESQTLDARITSLESINQNQYMVSDISSQLTINDGITVNWIDVDAAVATNYKIVVPGDDYKVGIQGFTNPVAGQSVTIYIDSSAVNGQQSFIPQSMNSTVHPDYLVISSTSGRQYGIAHIFYDGTDYWFSGGSQFNDAGS